MDVAALRIPCGLPYAAAAISCDGFRQDKDFDAVFGGVVVIAAQSHLSRFVHLIADMSMFGYQFYSIEIFLVILEKRTPENRVPKDSRRFLHDSMGQNFVPDILTHRVKTVSFVNILHDANSQPIGIVLAGFFLRHSRISCGPAEMLSHPPGLRDGCFRDVY
ncbi:hypothetical protein QAD02_017949 [Eretmocerus hayati]|uniref:Uncharacterized protein n=1 Tax=Eretmocerus hayati TaxID=131215 RepID=A0ACC2PFB7_9HYME|nr:hypothetical protein QAD02_017949 [Eretmocerus hayati]